jgi:hypothetical protein
MIDPFTLWTTVGWGASHSFPLTGGDAIAEATYEDDDGVEVRITVFADQDRQPVEVDFWKADFAPLLGFPSQNQLKDVKSVL